MQLFGGGVAENGPKHRPPLGLFNFSNFMLVSALITSVYRCRDRFEDPTPLRYKLLKYMQNSCSDTFTSCYTRNGNIKAKLRHLKNGSPSLHLMISSNTNLMLLINRQAVAKYLATKSTEKILTSVNSEIKHSVQATTYT